MLIYYKKILENFFHIGLIYVVHKYKNNLLFIVHKIFIIKLLLL